ncbi:MAG: FHA domain-containing protein, partial [Algisphaera sp.]
MKVPQLLKLFLIDTKKPGRHKTFRVADDQIEVLGRHAPRLQLNDTRVSRSHAEVSVQNGVWIIRDLESANGTQVNNQSISGTCQLEEDDVIQIGRMTLLVAVAKVQASEATAEPPIVSPAYLSPGLDDTAASGLVLQTENDSPQNDLQKELAQGLSEESDDLDDLSDLDKPQRADHDEPNAYDAPPSRPESPLAEHDDEEDGAQQGMPPEQDLDIPPVEDLLADPSALDDSGPFDSDLVDAHDEEDYDDDYDDDDDDDDDAPNLRLANYDLAEQKEDHAAPDTTSDLKEHPTENITAVAPVQTVQDDTSEQATASETQADAQADTPPDAPLVDTQDNTQDNTQEDSQAPKAISSSSLQTSVDDIAVQIYYSNELNVAKSPSAKTASVSDDTLDGMPDDTANINRDTPRDTPHANAAASADSRLVAPAPDSTLRSSRPHIGKQGFPWKGTLAALLTLAGIGGAIYGLGLGRNGGLATPVSITGPPAPGHNTSKTTNGETTATPQSPRPAPTPVAASSRDDKKVFTTPPLARRPQSDE